MAMNGATVAADLVAQMDADGAFDATPPEEIAAQKATIEAALTRHFDKLIEHITNNAVVTVNVGGTDYTGTIE